MTKSEGSEAEAGSTEQAGTGSLHLGPPQPWGPGATHLYQAPDVGYVWGAVTNSFIFFHLQNTQKQCSM